jgi:transcription antitermination factor NusG
MWSDLNRIRQLITSGSQITPEERLVSGMTVEIISGPLIGLRGKILRIDSRRRFVVGVEFMQQGASILLDDATLIREVPVDPVSGRLERCPAQTP